MALIIAMVAMPLLRYQSFHSSLFDLGIFQSLLSASAWQVAFSAHAHVFLPIWSAMLAAASPEMRVLYLLVLQTLAVIIPILLCFKIYGWGMAAAFILFSPLWINILFDFHFDHLAIPLLLGFYLALRARKPSWALAPALLLMGVKEPFALQTLGCGLLLLWIGLRDSNLAITVDNKTIFRQRRAFIAAGLVLVITGGAYFYFATHYLIPYFSSNGGGALSSGAFSWLGENVGQMMLTVLTHPWDVLKDIFTTSGKSSYLFVVFGLLLFIPLLAPSYLIPALPLLAIALLSRLPNYYDYNTHYTAGLIIPIMFAFIHGLPKAHALWMKGSKWVWQKLIVRHPMPRPQEMSTVVESKLSQAFYALLALWIIAGHVMVSPSPISRLFWSDKVWSYSWQAYVPTEREAMMKEALLRYIPADPDVSVTTQNTVNWYHLAHRKVYAPFPVGISEPIKVMDWSSRTWDGFWEFVSTGEMSPPVTHDRYADYVVLDLKRPWFLVDKGCEWVYGRCRNQEAAEKFLAWVERTRSLYNVVFERDGFMILQRKT